MRLARSQLFGSHLLALMVLTRVWIRVWPLLK
jgi:hypothetical protein